MKTIYPYLHFQLKYAESTYSPVSKYILKLKRYFLTVPCHWTQWGGENVEPPELQMSFPGRLVATFLSLFLPCPPIHATPPPLSMPPSPIVKNPTWLEAVECRYYGYRALKGQWQEKFSSMRGIDLDKTLQRWENSQSEGIRGGVTLSQKQSKSPQKKLSLSCLERTQMYRISYFL